MVITRALRRPISWTLLTSVLLSACASWRVQPVAPEQLLATQHPSSVRVTQKGGYRFVLDSPRISGDSLVGAAAGQPSGVPLADIAAIEVRHGDGVKSTALVVVLVGVGAIVFVYAVASAMSGNN